MMVLRSRQFRVGECFCLLSGSVFRKGYPPSMKTKPRYLEIVESLGAELRNLPPNCLIPTENQLAKRFTVSRVTLRRALAFLQRTGAISRQRGQGTVVNPPKITRHMVPNSTIEQDFLNQGFEVETQPLAYEPRLSPPEHVRAALRLSHGEFAGYLTLLRLVQGRIICLDQRFFPPKIAENFDAAQIGRRPFHNILDDVTGTPIVRSTSEMEIVPADADVASPLRITPGVLVLQNTFAAFSNLDMPIETGVVSYRIDRVKLGFVFADHTNRL